MVRGATRGLQMTSSFRLLIFTGALLLAGMVALRFGGQGDRSQAKSRLPVLHETGRFSLTNQAGALVRSEDLRGRPWAVNLIFTRCPGPCRQLTGVMREIQDGLGAGSAARLLTLTSDPEFDSPGVLASYGERFGADTNRWQFLTGSLGELRRVVTEGFLLVLVDKPEAQRETPDDLFLHSTLIVVMDSQGRLRTAIEGLEPGAARRVLEALRSLERED